jgi:hypothetical protein
MIQPPNAQSTLATLSGIYGIQQARQNLATGEINQQTAQAESDQAQQKNSELQKAQAVAINGARSGAYDDGNGGIDRQKMANDIVKVAPIYGQGQVGALLSQANEVVQNQQAHQNLTVSEKKEMGDTFGSLAADPTLDNSKVIDAIEKLREAHPNNPEYSRLLTSQVMHFPNTGTQDQMRQILSRWSAGATGDSQATPTQMDTGPSIQPGTQNKSTGAFTPGGPPVAKGLAPTQQPGYIRATAAAGTEGGQGASNDEKLYNDIMQSGTKATQIKSLSQDVQGLANEVQTGQYSKAFADKWAAVAQTFGFPAGAMDSATKRQLLSKAAARLKMQSEAGASTDAERAGVDAAMPDPEHMTPQAVQEAARYVGAQADVNSARMDLANKHRQINGGTSTGLRSTDSQFMQSADPKVFEYQGIPAGKARQDYLRQHFTNANDLKAFLAKADALKSYGALK